MNVVESVRLYVDKMIQGAGPGMKILLLDKETTSVVSNVYSQSEIMQKEVYLCDRLDNFKNREPLRHLKCLTLLRPTEENVTSLAQELKSPLYGSYFLYWTNIISKSEVKRLAEADEHEVVREISEFFLDFIPISPQTFTTNTPHGLIFTNSDLLDDTKTFLITQAIVSFLLATKRNPYIRYTEWSLPSQKLADKIQSMMSKESSLFEFRSSSRPVLLLLDRRDDPVTPLLNQWTYQAMVHELLTIKNQRVSLENAPGVPKDFREVVLSGQSDKFYSDNLYADFGAVGQSLRALVEEFQSKAKSHAKVESIEDMKNFIESYPAFKQMSGTVSKHVAVVGELARLNEQNSLLEISELEQEITCHSNHSASLARIKSLISNGKIQEKDLLRLVLLYALKFESHSNNDIMGLVTKLKNRGVDEEKLSLVKGILKFGGIKKRKSDLFGTNDAVAVTKRFMKGLQGVENIYTQHRPWVRSVAEDCLRGKLKESIFPYYALNASEAPLGSDPNWRPSELIIFIIGGITYAESLALHNLNREEGRAAITLGGTGIWNMEQFLEEVKASMRKSTN